MSSTEPESNLVSEFGEPVELRAGGCPHCGADFVSIYASKCWKCERRFLPASTLLDEPG